MSSCGFFCQPSFNVHMLMIIFFLSGAKKPTTADEKNWKKKCLKKFQPGNEIKLMMKIIPEKMNKFSLVAFNRNVYYYFFAEKLIQFLY